MSLASAARIAANRANAEHSTGPRTAEGKVRSAANARTHGLSASTLTIAEQDREEFERHKAALLNETQPQGVLECEAVERMLFNSWNRLRAERLESQVLTACEAHPSPDLFAQLDRLSRYRVRHERSYQQALRELRHLQTCRALVSPAAERPPVADPIEIAKFNLCAKRTQAAAKREDPHPAAAAVKEPGGCGSTSSGTPMHSRA